MGNRPMSDDTQREHETDEASNAETNQDTADGTNANVDVGVTAASSTYKVLGEFSDSAGAGVLGKNNASSGTPIGVEGSVPNASGGYGLSTPHDARIGGIAELDAIDTNDADFTVETGPDSTGDSSAVVLGHESNAASSVGATVGGGGFDDGSTAKPNLANGRYSTVGGGEANEITKRHSTIAGGRNNLVEGRRATIAGGWSNQVSDENAAVAGGFNNIVFSGSESFVGGGQNNFVYDDYGTIGGGEGNQTGSDDGSTQDPTNATHTTVAGGTGNEASATNATVAGGTSNTATGISATVAGGANNSASGGTSFAAGNRAKATTLGTFVWADSQSSDFSSTGSDQFLVRAQGGVGVGTDSPSTQLDVDGAVTASKGVRGNVGASAYRNTNQTATSGTTETIVFNAERADERNEFDTSTGEFTCAYDGTYHVDASVNLAAATVQGGEEVQIRISVNSVAEAINVCQVDANAGDPSYTYSKTLFGLSSGDVITVRFSNVSNHDLDIYGGSHYWTWVTIHQVG